MTLSSPNLKVILFTTYHDANIAFLFEYFREYFVSGCNRDNLFFKKILQIKFKYLRRP